jgi:hypothetical protein
MFQTYCYWIMSALTNDPRRLARYAGKPLSLLSKIPPSSIPLDLSLS